MSDKIVLAVDKTLNSLAGNRFGRSVYKEQIKDRIEKDKVNYIVIPQQIEDVASSFIQGLYYELSEQYGKERAREIMVLESENVDVMEKIKYSLRVYML